MPFVGPQGRQATPERGAKRHDDLELVCRDETTVERFIGYIDQAELSERDITAVDRGIERSEQEELRAQPPATPRRTSAAQIGCDPGAIRRRRSIVSCCGARPGR